MLYEFEKRKLYKLYIYDLFGVRSNFLFRSSRIDWHPVRSQKVIMFSIPREKSSRVQTYSVCNYNNLSTKTSLRNAAVS